MPAPLDEEEAKAGLEAAAGFEARDVAGDARRDEGEERHGRAMDDLVVDRRPTEDIGARRRAPSSASRLARRRKLLAQLRSPERPHPPGSIRPHAVIAELAAS